MFSWLEGKWWTWIFWGAIIWWVWQNFLTPTT